MHIQLHMLNLVHKVHNDNLKYAENQFDIRSLRLL